MRLPAASRERRSLAYPALLALGALDAAGYSIVAPVLPAVSSATRAGPALIGALVAAFPVGIVIAFPLAARTIARGTSTSAVVAVSLVTAAIGAVLFLGPESLVFYFLGRFVMGLGSGALWIGVTFGTLERWPGQEYLCMSRVFAAYSVGGLVGPAIGALGGIRAPFLTYLVLTVACLALVPALGGPAHRRSFRADRSALRSPGFAAASAGILFAIMALGLMEGVLPLRFSEQLSQGAIGALFVGAALVHAVGATAAARLPPRTAVYLSIVFATAGIALAAAGTSIAIWLPSLAIAGVGVGSGETGSIGILLGSVPTERIVTAMVVWSQIGIVGYLIGPLAGGAVAQWLGIAAVGLVPLVAGVVVWRMVRASPGLPAEGAA